VSASPVSNALRLPVPFGRPAGFLSSVTLGAIEVNDRTIANKIAGGGFSAVFFLQVMEAIGVKNLPLDTGD
jgi:Domain of unknown function (DUF6471)